MTRFPKNFYWGVATSAHQVEGGNKNDWTEWERENAKRLAQEAAKKQWPDFILQKYPNPLQEENYISGRACDHYHRFREDFDIAKSLGHNAHRFSIEWSRIEPEEGKFDEKEIEHYREVLQALRERGLEPFVTLWHWTLPLWVRDWGGVENRKFPFYFARYAKHAVEKLGSGVNFWMTLNEPTSVITASYSKGVWPPQKKSPFAALRVFHVLARAHAAAYRAIHAIQPLAQVGFGNILYFVEPAYSNNLFDRLSARIANFWSNRYFLYLTGNTHDYLALQYYFHLRIKFPWKINNENKKVSDMGWELYPEGLYHLLKHLSKYKKPIYITENGLADARDQYRSWYIRESLENVAQAVKEGVDVRGYFYWSLMDNFEWDKGFWARFGLIEIDYKTLERKIRPSAYVYAKIIKENALTI